MTYFNHYNCTPEQGLRQAINHILATDVVTDDGLTKQSNYTYVEKLALKSLVPTTTKYVLGNMWSHGLTFMLAPHVTGSDMKDIVDMILWLEESPVLSDTEYSDLCYEEATKQVTEIANDYDVDPEVLVDLYFDNDIYSYEENGELYISMSQEVLDELISEARVKSQSRDMHYTSGKYHTPEVCTYCQEFPELIGAR
jgi:hypothetical protein